MTITLPDDLIDALGDVSLHIEKRDAGRFRLVVVEDDEFEIVDGYGITLEEASWALESSAEEWLKELNTAV